MKGSDTRRITPRTRIIDAGQKRVMRCHLHVYVGEGLLVSRLKGRVPYLGH
jgi:hypothetical protein